MEILKVYVAGKYSADNVLDVLKNIGKGKQTCAELFMLGFAPFCPWHDASYVTDNPRAEFDKAMFYDASMAWLECSEAVYVISGKGEGTGVDAELDRAKELGIPVFESLMKLLSWKEEMEQASTFVWQCKYCGENEKPQCHKCVEIAPSINPSYL